MRYFRNTFEKPIENLNTLETPFKQPRNTHETPLNPFKHLLNTFKHLLNTLGARFKHPCDTLETALEQLLKVGSGIHTSLLKNKVKWWPL